MQSNHRRTRGAALLWLVLVVLGLAAGGIFLWQGREDVAGQETTLPWTATKEKLRISVVESGQLKAAKSVDIYCEVKGGAIILELVDEGTKVTAGDTLVRLDASNLEDELTAQKIKKLNAEAAFIQADKTKQIQESKNQSDIDKALVDLDLARTDLDKYNEGDYKLQVKQAESDITLAESDLKLKEAKSKDTDELVDLDFAAKTEADSDRLAKEQAKVKHEMSLLSKEMLEKFENKRQLQVLESDVKQTAAELDRVKLRCEADLAQKVADYESKKATFDLEKNKLADLEQQVHRTVITAPADGLVVYPMNQNGGGRGGSDRDRVEEGATAREHQLLLSLPDASEMVVMVSVHESAIDKLKLGQPVLVTIDAKADLSYVGKVSFIAPLPDSQNQWLNPDLKVYRSEITLGGDTTMLRPGMSASAEIVIDELNDAIAVPVHAVHHRGGHYFVYVAEDDGGCVIREVKIGLHNDKRVALTHGLKEGEKIHLTVPAGAPQPDFPESPEKAATSVAELRKTADAIQPKSAKPEEEKTADASPAGGFDMSKFKDMTPEQAKKAWDDYIATLTPEKRKEVEDRMKQFGGRGGAPGGGGPPGDGGRDRKSSGGGN